MAKELRCAQCGMVLNTVLKGIPQTGSVMELVEPHKCTKEVADFSVTPPKRTLEDVNRLEALPFSQKITEVRKSALLQVHTDDRRKAREEIQTTIAPRSLLQAYAKDDFSDGGEMEG
jgi:hypothetical protein